MIYQNDLPVRICPYLSKRLHRMQTLAGDLPIIGCKDVYFFRAINNSNHQASQFHQLEASALVDR